MSFERTCRTCTHAGADPDGPYCAAPEVMAQHSYGRAIKDVPGVAGFCELPNLPLYEKDRRKRFFKKGEK